MKNYLDNFIKCITYDSPEVIPVSVNILPSVYKKYAGDASRIFQKFEHFFDDDEINFDYENALPRTYKTGTYIDEWGCVWENIHEGQGSYVTGHPIKNREQILALKEPTEISDALGHSFMFLRLIDLRGYEEVMVDFAEEAPELSLLISAVLSYNLKVVEKQLSKPTGPIFYCGDDLGTQIGLPISKNHWMKYLFDCYKQIFGAIKAHNKYVYFHTDGKITNIMPEIKQAGADMINPQIGANPIDELATVCKGKIPINLGLDRQQIPFMSPKDIDDHIKECISKMYLKEGGLGITLEIAEDFSPETIHACLESLERHRFYTV